MREAADGMLLVGAVMIGVVVGLIGYQVSMPWQECVFVVIFTFGGVGLLASSIVGAITGR
jgi:hypothetical protein